jgi:benzoate 4-monooxygenase
MTWTQALGSFDPASLLIFLLSVVFLVHFVHWLLDPYGIRSIPGPFLAKFSDAWLGWVSAHGHRSEVVHEMHMKYGTSNRSPVNLQSFNFLHLGPLVRLAPNHVSVAIPAALQVIYGHGNGALKSNFYDAFVSLRRGIFNTRDRVQHARKRKIVSHIFSTKSVAEFEPNVREYVGILIKRWDALCDAAKERQRGEDGGGWTARDGRVWLDCLPWYNFLAFDIIGKSMHAHAS